MVDNGRRYTAKSTRNGGAIGRSCPIGGGAPSRDSLDLMSKIRAIDFAIQDTVLYLDAYPCCAEALEYYHSLLDVRERLVKEYENGCAPITKTGNLSRTSWDWIASPWPWESDAYGR